LETFGAARGLGRISAAKAEGALARSRNFVFFNGGPPANTGRFDLFTPSWGEGTYYQKLLNFRLRTQGKEEEAGQGESSETRAGAVRQKPPRAS